MLQRVAAATSMHMEAGMQGASYEVYDIRSRLWWRSSTAIVTPHVC